MWAAAEPVAITSATFDKKEQYDQIIPWILPGEQLHVVLDCKGGGTGFIADHRQAPDVLRQGVSREAEGPDQHPLNKVTSVSSVNEGRGLFGATSELVLKTGSGGL